MLHDPKRAEAARPVPIRRGLLAGWWRREGWAQRLLREPILHFLFAGAVILAVGHGYEARTNLYRIELTPSHVAELSRRYALQYGAPPDRQTLDQIVRDDIHDEILYRQGRALGLDRDDEIVRRRVIQKSQFLLENTRAPAEPTDADLGRFYAGHPERYAAPARASFTHVFFADNQDGEARARAELPKLAPDVTRGPAHGDPFPDLYDFNGYDAEQAARLFGHTPLAQAVFTAPLGRWAGPFRSAYGWHLIRVAARTEPRLPPLPEVRDRVRMDYLQASQEDANAAAFRQLASRFQIIRKDKTGAP